MISYLRQGSMMKHSILLYLLNLVERYSCFDSWYMFADNFQTCSMEKNHMNRRLATVVKFICGVNARQQMMDETNSNIRMSIRIAEECIHIRTGDQIQSLGKDGPCKVACAVHFFAAVAGATTTHHFVVIAHNNVVFGPSPGQSESQDTIS